MFTWESSFTLKIPARCLQSNGWPFQSIYILNYDNVKHTIQLVNAILKLYEFRLNIFFLFCYDSSFHFNVKNKYKIKNNDSRQILPKKLLLYIMIF